jgi:hypothetical protein
MKEALRQTELEKTKARVAGALGRLGASQNCSRTLSSERTECFAATQALETLDEPRCYESGIRYFNTAQHCPTSMAMKLTSRRFPEEHAISNSRLLHTICLIRGNSQILSRNIR